MIKGDRVLILEHEDLREREQVQEKRVANHLNLKGVVVAIYKWHLHRKELFAPLVAQIT